MQRKKSAAGEKSSGQEVPEETKADAVSTETAMGGKVGRPATSPLDRKTQVRENVRAHRAKLKAAGVKKIETYLPNAWHAFLQGTGEPLQELGAKAFSLLLRERGANALVEAEQAFIVPSKKEGSPASPLDL